MHLRPGLHQHPSLQERISRKILRSFFEQTSMVKTTEHPKQPASPTDLNPGRLQQSVSNRALILAGDVFPVLEHIQN